MALCPTQYSIPSILTWLQKPLSDLPPGLEPPPNLIPSLWLISSFRDAPLCAARVGAPRRALLRPRRTWRDAVGISLHLSSFVPHCFVGLEKDIFSL